MPLGAGVLCVKYLVFCFNLLFSITGLIILIVGAKAQISLSPYVELTDESFYVTGPILLIIVGVIVFIVAFFGCCGAVKENHCMINTFSVFLLIIFVMEVAVGFAGYMKHQDLEDSIMRHLNSSITQYPTNPEVRKTFDIIQTDLQCCGIYGPGDWHTNDMPIPESCCAAREIREGAVAACGEASGALHRAGCVPALLAALRAAAAALAGVGLGIALVQLLGVIFACCLARSIRSQYETV